MLLELRLADGLCWSAVLATSERHRLPDLVARGLIEQRDGRASVLAADAGRLLADGDSAADLSEIE